MKTLKDMDIDRFDGYPVDEPEGKGVSIIELREEAKKGVEQLWKEEIDDRHTDVLREARCENNGGCDDAGFCVSPNKDIIHWINNFFNLEEEQK